MWDSGGRRLLRGGEGSEGMTGGRGKVLHEGQERGARGRAVIKVASVGYEAGGKEKG